MATRKAKKQVADCCLYEFIPLLNANIALLTLLNIMALPAVLMMALGGIFWRRGWLLQNEDKIRLGRLLLMFGTILLVIVLITTYFLEQMQTHVS